MRWIALTALLAVTIVSFGLGVWVGRENRTTSVSPQLTCRPSFPEMAVATTPKPAILFFGNSLLFDHGWRIPGAIVINCARQGMLAREALQLMGTLPEVDPRMIVLSFGSVEVVRAAKTEDAVRRPEFEQSIEGITASLKTRWPNSKIIWTAIPRSEDEGDRIVMRQPDIDLVNEAIRTLSSPTALIELDQEVQVLRDRSIPVLYDGVHLSGQAYTQWERAIVKAFSAQ